MPCSDGGPSLVQQAQQQANPYNTQPQLASSADLREAKEKLDDVTSMLCELCGELEDNNQDIYIKDIPELKVWWIAHKEQDRINAEIRKEQYEAALENARNARKQQKQYLKYLLDEFLDEADKEYFKRKLHNLQVEIDEAVGNFPEMIPVIGQNIIKYNL